MKKILSVIIAATLVCGTAFATHEPDQEEAFDDAVQNFGFVSGLAHQCVPAEKKGEVERKVLKAYTGIVSLFGSDQAFFYAAAFGAGSTAQFDHNECEKNIEIFEKQLSKNSTKE